MAALSVQNSGLGKNARPPAAATLRVSASRSRRFAPTPPATTSVLRPVCRSARIDFVTSVSTIALSNPRATSARAASSSVRPRTATTTAVFKSAEAEIESGPVEHRPRELEYAVAAVLGNASERGPTRIAEPEELGGLVKGLAGGIILGLAEDPVSPDPGDFNQHGVSSRDL